MSPDLHVDRYAVNPLTGQRRFLAWIDPDEVGAQEREGWSTYTEVSEPHTMADCPELVSTDGHGREKRDG